MENDKLYHVAMCFMALLHPDKYSLVYYHDTKELILMNKKNWNQYCLPLTIDDIYKCDTLFNVGCYEINRYDIDLKLHEYYQYKLGGANPSYIHAFVKSMVEL